MTPLRTFIAEHGLLALIADALGVMTVSVLGVGALYGVGEAVHFGGLNPFGRAIAADAAPGSISLRSTEPLRVSAPSGSRSHIAQEAR